MNFKLCVGRFSGRFDDRLADDAAGAIIQARPEISVVLTWGNADFDRVWALALSGQLKYSHLYFTKPHYNSGLVVSASFSNELEE